MRVRTFIPTLVKATHWLCVYIGKHDEAIQDFLPEAVLPAYAVLKTACRGFLDAYNGSLSV
jgi:hypothetical protein